MNFLSQTIAAKPEPDWAALLALPIAESHDPLVPLGLVNSPLRSYPAYFHQGVPNALSECYVRRCVLFRLYKAARLLPSGIELVVLDGWRPLLVQQYLFDSLFAAMNAHYANDSESELFNRTRRFIAPPSNEPTAPSPHLTGGSVDVALCDVEGLFLDMGTEFDDISPWSYSAAFEAVEKPSAREAEVIENRRLLHSVMIQAGFTNLPSEWWHFDYGNQSWAWSSKSSEAQLGAIELQPLRQRWRRQVAL
ncbi:MAG: M15 family metallopeptidase [Oceanisphaera sp.]|uniref:M15 family metallopeptidase n=1 Tax=Oceanisphaera sp. TaxID=1929979 RepID=UPI003C7333F0